MKKVAVTYQPGLKARADFVAEQLGSPVLEETSEPSKDTRLFLNVAEQGLSLFHADSPKSALSVDFLAGVNNHRRIYGGGKNQLIGKAVGLSKGFKPSILDMTAGLGRDAFVLASLGANVTLCESNPVVYWLLRDGIERAINHPEPDSSLPDIMQRMTLIAGSSREYLANNPKVAIDIIYLDPMFPVRTKSARVKKDMALLHELLGFENDGSDLLEPALAAATYRVVVKRPSHAPFLGNREPGFSLKGKSVRFDIYPLAKLPGK